MCTTVLIVFTTKEKSRDPLGSDEICSMVLSCPCDALPLPALKTKRLGQAREALAADAVTVARHAAIANDDGDDGATALAAQAVDGHGQSVLRLRRGDPAKQAGARRAPTPRYDPVAWGQTRNFTRGSSEKPSGATSGANEADAKAHWVWGADALGSRGEREVPVVGVTVFVDPKQYLRRLLASLDQPIGVLVIVVFGNHDTGAALAVAQVQDPAARARHFPRLDVRRVEVRAYPVNMGCAFGFNEVILAVPGAPWWLLVNYDVAFTPAGVLGRMAAAVHGRLAADAHEAAVAEPAERAFSGSSASPPPPPPLALHTFTFEYGAVNVWSNFALTRAAVARVGLFDENLFPAYWEDGDYLLRVTEAFRGQTQGGGDGAHTKLEDRTLYGAVHGEAGATEYRSGTRDNLKAAAAAMSTTARFEKARWLGERRAADNGAYMMAKHGQVRSFGHVWKR